MLKSAIITGRFADTPCDIHVTPFEKDDMIDTDRVMLHLGGGPLEISVTDLVAARDAFRSCRAEEPLAPPPPPKPGEERWSEAAGGAAG